MIQISLLKLKMITKKISVFKVLLNNTFYVLNVIFPAKR